MMHNRTSIQSSDNLSGIIQLAKGNSSRDNSRAGRYWPKLYAKSGEFRLNVPKLRGFNSGFKFEIAVENSRLRKL